MPCWQRKVELSNELQKSIFRRRLRHHEIDRLKIRCEKYQNLSPPNWDETIFPAYTMYFGFLTALKVKASLEELRHFGYLTEGEWSFFDFGAGTLGASLGAKDFLGPNLKEIQSEDRDDRPLNWAQSEFSDVFGTTRFVHRAMGRKIWTACDVLNEMPPPARLNLIQSWISQMSSEDLILLIEPASKEANQKLLQLRDEITSKVNILLPCTHQQVCPALAQNEWCHEDRDYLAPPEFHQLVRDLGFRRSSLSYSLLVLGKQNSVFSFDQARVVSQPLKSKGREEKWLCAKGQRWKAGMASRKVNEETLAFAEARRGDILPLRPEWEPKR